MDFDDSPAEAAFRAEARAFLEANAKPKGPDSVGHGASHVAGSAEEQQHVRKAQAWQATLYDSGWAGITWPKEYGGRGGTSVQQMIWNQELSTFDAAPGVFSSAAGGAFPTLNADAWLSLTWERSDFLSPAWLPAPEVSGTPDGPTRTLWQWNAAPSAARRFWRMRASRP